MEFEQITDYITNLYAAKKDLTRKQYAGRTELKDFIPTVDDDVARLLKLPPPSDPRQTCA